MRNRVRVELRSEIDELYALASTTRANVTSIQTTFVYRPGDPAPSGNVYASWPALMAAQLAVQGPKIIQIDDSIISPAVIPAGTWDLFNCTLVGNLETPLGVARPVQAQAADGCVFLHIAQIYNNLTITSVSAAPVHTLTEEQALILSTAVVLDSAAGAAPFLSAPGPYAVPPNIVLQVGGQLGTTPGQDVLTIAAGASTNVFLDSLSTLPNDVITGAGTAVIVIDECATMQFGNVTIPFTQVGVTTLVVIDASTYGFATYYCDGLSAAGNAGNPTSLPPGSGPTTSTGVWNPVAEGITTFGSFIFASGFLTKLLVGIGGTGNAGDAGTSVVFQVYVSGVAVPGSSVSIVAEAGGGATAMFLGGYNPGDFVQVVATPSAPLVGALSIIAAGLA